MYTTSGTYIDSLTASNGCDSIVKTGLIVLPQFMVTVTAYTATTVCSGSTVTLSMLGNANPNFAYQWSDANGVIVGATSSTYSASISGEYSLGVINSNGCIATSAAVTVTVISPAAPSVLSTSSIGLDRATMNWSSTSTSTDHYDVRLGNREELGQLL